MTGEKELFSLGMSPLIGHLIPVVIPKTIQKSNTKETQQLYLHIYLHTHVAIIKEKETMNFRGRRV